MIITESNLISVKNITIQNNLTYNEFTLLTYKIEYPQFYSSKFNSCLQGINKIYKQKAIEYKNYCEKELFRMAVGQYKESINNGFPVRAFDVVQIYNVTYSRACIISIYFDRYEYTGGAHGRTIRKSQTWQLLNCNFVKLEQLISCKPDYRHFVLGVIEKQIKKHPEIYFENYQELIAKNFNKNSYYCRQDGIVAYYQQYDIAPYSSGIREFLIPYDGCVKDPDKLCRQNN